MQLNSTVDDLELMKKINKLEQQINKLTEQNCNQKIDELKNIMQKTNEIITSKIIFSNVKTAPIIGDTNIKDNKSVSEQQMYQSAIDNLPDNKQEAKNKLQSYIKIFPNGIYIANAHYWIGEINFVQKNFNDAEIEFKLVMDKFPKSKRSADAKLKLALIYKYQKKIEKYKHELQELIQYYPGTTAAQLAKQQLDIEIYDE